MTDYQLQSSRFHKEVDFSSSGVLAPTGGHKLYGEQTLTVNVRGVQPTNEVQIQGRVTGCDDWVILGEIKGNQPLQRVDIKNVDHIRFNVVNYVSDGKGFPARLTASGFFNSDGIQHAELMKAIWTLNETQMKVNSSLQNILLKLNGLETYLAIITDEESL